MSEKHPLSQYARDAGISMEALAKRAETSRATLYRVMEGENATIDVVKRISAATGGKVSVGEIIGGTQEPAA